MVDVRRAVAADNEAIWRVHTQAIRVLCRERYSAAELEAWAGSKTPDSYGEVLQTREMYVAERDDQVIGFGQLDLASGEVEAVYVSPGAARTGVGATLLSHLEEVAVQSGHSEITLKSTLNAEPFYAHQGYETLGPAEHQGLDCVCMRKSLR